MKGDAELEALIRAVDGDARLEVELGEVLGRFRRRRERDMRDMQIADLLHEGADKCVERFGCARRTVYWRAARGRRLKAVQRIA